MFYLDEKYIASSAYTACEPDEIGFQKGVVVDVLQKNVDGWWLIRYCSHWCMPKRNGVGTIFRTWRDIRTFNSSEGSLIVQP